MDLRNLPNPRLNSDSGDFLDARLGKKFFAQYCRLILQLQTTSIDEGAQHLSGFLRHGFLELVVQKTTKNGQVVVISKKFR